ncbi:hypothetical protein [Bradyrhizobium retamae]|uniref:hypothetical protein n=1 Tax=Bradyrhizobium retamae TaxID=1300035 RepID=UPI000A883F47|nr:hypothetical protein [Bradyrhizobium retamae]
MASVLSLCGRLHIYVRRHCAGERAMASITRSLTDKLRLTVKEAESAVARPEERKFLGSVLRATGRTTHCAESAR